MRPGRLVLNADNRPVRASTFTSSMPLRPGTLNRAAGHAEPGDVQGGIGADRGLRGEARLAFFQSAT